jgi:hypothetical protein
MARHRFRSQPTLQRSGSRAPSAILAACTVAGIAMGAGALVGIIPRALGPEPAPLPVFRPLDAPAPHAVAAATPAPQAALAEAAIIPARAAATPAVRARARPAPRAAHGAQPPKYAVAEPPAEARRRQAQLDYERARAAYDASERKEGYRWAQQNRIRILRYCHAAAQRTAPFMEGCLSYVRSAGPDGARASGAAQPADQG